MNARRRVTGVVASFALLAATLVLLAEPGATTGTLDTTFGAGGAAVVDFGAASTDRVTDMAIQSDGKVVLLVDTTAGAGLVRLTTGGVLDTSFDTDGRVDLPSIADANGLALVNDGAVVVGRTATTDGDLVVLRYTSAGVLDTTFSGDGRLEVAMAGTGSGGLDVAVSGTNIVTLSLDDVNGAPTNPAVVLHRFTDAGLPDNGFDTDGRLNTAYTSSTAGTLLRPRLLVTGAGSPVVVIPGTAGGRVARYTTSGTPDGTAVLSHSTRALTVQGDGKYVVAGGVGSQVHVTRLTTALAPDPAFGSAGTATFDVPDVSAPRALAVAMQSDGRVILAGRDDTGTTSRVFLVRMLANGSALDPSGFLSLTTAGSRTMSGAAALEVDSTGRVLVGGDGLNGGGSDHDAMALRVTLSTTSTSSTSSTSTSSTTTTAPVQVAAGGSRSSDPSGTVPSDGNRVVLTVTTPVAGAVGITKPVPPSIANHRVVGAITVTAPAATAGSPLRFDFSVDVSTVPTDVPLSSLAVLRDGVAVPVCTGSTAAPDPCLVSKSRTGNVLTASVRTSKGSTWAFTRPVADRVTATDVDTAIAASRLAFGSRAAGAVVVARADDFADALAGIPLAKRHNAPLLLTPRAELSDAVLTEITRVLPAAKTVYLLGGEAALAPAVASRLRSWGYEVVRYGAATRYDTAVTVATQGLGSPTTVVETTGANFADAFAAGAVAAKLNGAVLLTNHDRQAAATTTYLNRVRPTRYAVGGPATIADKTATAISGRDRYETAVLTARRFFTAPPFLAMASGGSYTDAATAAAFAALSGAPLLLLPTDGGLPVPLQIYLDEIATARPTAAVFGPVASVSDAVLTPLRTKLGA